MPFVPDGYQIPKTSGNYLRLEEGETTIRILSSAIIGWVGWTEDSEGRKPKRFRMTDKPTDLSVFDKKQIKHFWAFVVWNVNDEKVQIMEVTQSSIQQDIKALIENKKWGDPTGYDITINRKGKSLDTEYSVMPNPHSPLDPKIEQTYIATTIYLEALYTGDDPFAPATDQPLKRS